MSKLREHIAVLSLLSVFVLFQGCANRYSARNKSTERWNLSAIYNPLSTKLHPVYSIYHQTNTNSILYVKLFTSELRFQSINGNDGDVSKIKIEASLFEEDTNKVVLADSVVQEFIITEEESTHVYHTQLALKTEFGKQYQLRIVVRDMIRKSFNLQFIDIDKTSMYSAQSFLLTDKNGIPHFSNVLSSGQLFKVKHPLPKSDKIYISYYQNNVPLPQPGLPRISDESIYHDPDSIWAIPYSSNLVLQFTYPGMYFFRFDTVSNDGFTAINPGGGFPKVKEPNEMIEPLYYITNKAEYQKMLDTENPKLTIDKFWLQTGKSTSRGRELIRIYYNRVYFANYYFSNSRHGWKTDRGMIYVVYGPPDNLRKNIKAETWYYYRKGYEKPISFTFNHKPSAYNYNRYILDRSESHEWFWTDAVNTWAKGDVFLRD